MIVVRTSRRRPPTIKRMLGAMCVVAVVVAGLTGCVQSVGDNARATLATLIADFEERASTYALSGQTTEEVLARYLLEGVVGDLVAYPDLIAGQSTTSSPVLVKSGQQGGTLTLQLYASGYSQIGGGFFSHEAKVYTCAEYKVDIRDVTVSGKGIECPDEIKDQIDPTSEFVSLDDLREG